MTKCYSHGKILLTGEYMVLVGAEALAIPTKVGQSLEFKPNDSKTLNWESWDFKNKLWFNATIDIMILVFQTAVKDCLGYKNLKSRSGSKK